MLQTIVGTWVASMTKSMVIPIVGEGAPQMVIATKGINGKIST